MNFMKDLFDSFFKKVDDDSPRGKINKTDLIKTVRNALLTGAAAALAFVIHDGSLESLGVFQALAIAGLKALLDLINKLIKDNSSAEPDKIEE